MRDQILLEALRRHPTEWHRRGMTSPAEIAEIVAVRLDPSSTFVPVEPSYADFFAAA